MPEITVSLPLWIVAQVAVFLALIAVVISMQSKNKYRVLWVMCISYALYLVNLGLIQNWIVFLTIGVALARNITFAYFEHRTDHGKAVPEWWRLLACTLFVVATIVPVIFIWQTWFDWVLAVGSIPIIVGVYVKGVHVLKISIMVKASLNIASFVMFFNVVGILFEAFVISSIIVFYIRLLKARRSDKNVPRGTIGEQAEPPTVAEV